MSTRGGFHYVAAVTTPDDRADSSARNAAIKQVDEALKAGRIVQPDHDMRVDQLRRAQTMQDIDVAVRDLQLPPPVPPVTIAPVAATPTGQVTPGVIQDTTTGAAPQQSQQPWPLVNYGAGSPGSATLSGSSGKGGKAIGGIIAVIILVAVVVPIAGAVIAFVSARNSFPDFGNIGPSDDTTYLPGQAPGKDGVNVHTVEGYNDLVKAIQGESHAAYVYSAVLYPRYAVVDVPTGTNTRFESFYWDGEHLQLEDIKGTSDNEQVDLSLLDAQRVVDCVTTVRDRMDNPDSWYAVIDASMGQGPTLTCFANNEFSESTYIIEGFDGTVIYDSATQPPAS